MDTTWFPRSNNFIVGMFADAWREKNLKNRYSNDFHYEYANCIQIDFMTHKKLHWQ